MNLLYSNCNISKATPQPYYCQIRNNKNHHVNRCILGGLAPQPTTLGSSMNNTRESCKMRYADNIRNSKNKGLVQGVPKHVNQSIKVCVNTKPKYETAPPTRIPAFV